MTISSDAELELTQARIASLERTIAQARQSLANSPRALADLGALYQHQLDEFEADVRDYLGLSRSVSAPIELSFETEDGTAGTASTHALETVLESFRKTVTAIGEHLAGGSVREQGRPVARIGRAVDFRVTGVGLGSFRLFLELPVPPVAEIDESTQNLAERSLDFFDEMVRWVESGDDTVPSILEDADARRVFLSNLKGLAPSDLSPITWVEVRRRQPLSYPPTRLTAHTYHRIGQIIERSAPNVTVAIKGRLREINLERESFELLTPEGRTERCKVSPTLLQEALDHIHTQTPVLARGTKQKGGFLSVVSIEPLSEGEDHRDADVSLN